MRNGYLILCNFSQFTYIHKRFTPMIFQVCIFYDRLIFCNVSFIRCTLYDIGMYWLDIGLTQESYYYYWPTPHLQIDENWMHEWEYHRLARPRSEEHTPADRSLSMRTPFQMIRHVLVAGSSYYNSMFSTPCACHENRWLEKKNKKNGVWLY